MLRNFYKWIVPNTVRNQIYTTHYESILQQLENGLKCENSMPQVELSERHLANLKVLTNREALLEKLPKRAIVAEIGVLKGDFSNAILSKTNPEKLHLIDPWGLLNEKYEENAHFVRNRFREKIEAGQVIMNQGFSFSELDKFSDGYFDWIYIDSDHSYESTARELEMCRKKVKDDGIIAGHDYRSWSMHERMRYGVVEAVHEFCEKYDWEMIYLTHEVHRYISFAIRKCK